MTVVVQVYYCLLLLGAYKDALFLFDLPSHSGGGRGRGFDNRGITIHVLCELRHQRRLAIDGRIAGRNVHDTAIKN